MKVYCPAKTVADCFRFRNKVGLDVDLEALRDAWRKRQVTMADPGSVRQDRPSGDRNAPLPGDAEVIRPMNLTSHLMKRMVAL
jgi:hypothetical protein